MPYLASPNRCMGIPKQMNYLLFWIVTSLCQSENIGSKQYHHGSTSGKCRYWRNWKDHKNKKKTFLSIWDLLPACCLLHYKGFPCFFLLFLRVGPKVKTKSTHPKTFSQVLAIWFWKWEKKTMKKFWNFAPRGPRPHGPGPMGEERLTQKTHAAPKVETTSS